MSAGTVNITKHLKPQGLSPTSLHEGIVIDNKDPRKLCRLRIRIEGLFEGIPDDCLPWAIPRNIDHINGAYTNGWNDKTKDMSKVQERSGVYNIPMIGSKVTVQFMNSDPHFPTWSGYSVDEKVILKEELDGHTKDRYPYRSVLRMRNGTYIVADNETSEVFINSSGDLYLTVLGDVHETVVGNKTTKITSKITDIPEYIRKAPASYLDNMKRNAKQKVPWEGLTNYKKEGGNHHLYVEGDETILIKGNRVLTIGGNTTETINGNIVETIGGSNYTTAGAVHAVTAYQVIHSGINNQLR